LAVDRAAVDQALGVAEEGAAPEEGAVPVESKGPEAG
jgi:hypothetical protein